MGCYSVLFGLLSSNAIFTQGVMSISYQFYSTFTISKLPNICLQTSLGRTRFHRKVRKIPSGYYYHNQTTLVLAIKSYRRDAWAYQSDFVLTLFSKNFQFPIETVCRSSRLHLFSKLYSQQGYRQVLFCFVGCHFLIAKGSLFDLVAQNMQKW